jgi:NADH dehydrogenase
VKRIVVLGAGFAGLIAAAGAARKLAELKISKDDIAVTVVNRDPWHSIRVRNYETDLSDVRVALDDVLGPIGVDLVVGDVTGLDCGRREVACTVRGRPTIHPYDRLLFALGSELVRPAIPGLAEHGFDIDTYDAAAKLAAHLAGLSDRPASPGCFTALVVGGGLTGVEMATELATRLGAIAGAAPARVILADRAPRIGSNMGDAACDVIDEALHTLGVETRPGVTIASVGLDGARLSSGEEIAAETVVWCAGMRAHPLAPALPGPLDRFGRVAVDRFLKVEGTADIFAAGDVAAALVDGTHASVMSCQHARPMGRADPARDRLLRDLPRSRRLGRGLLPRLGPPGRRHRRRRQRDQTHDQLRADLPAALTRRGRNPRRRRAGDPGAAPARCSRCEPRRGMTALD